MTTKQAIKALINVESKNNFVNSNGELTEEYICIIQLLRMTGVNRLITPDDFYAFAYRVYWIFGDCYLLEDLLVNDVFFGIAKVKKLYSRKEYRNKERSIQEKGIYSFIDTNDIIALRGFSTTEYEFQDWDTLPPSFYTLLLPILSPDKKDERSPMLFNVRTTGAYPKLLDSRPIDDNKRVDYSRIFGEQLKKDFELQYAA
tara:strand:- start:617 stop:1219 length:603 start_codon:yes stop_codon:yes gene_type:complete